jgi:hypothetical protein
MRQDALADAVGMAEGYGAKAKDIVLKVGSALAELHSQIFPKEPLPETVVGLADVFRAEPSPFAKYSRTQTAVGSQLTIAIAAAHGVPEAELEKATSSFPVREDGTEVDLAPFIKAALPLAQSLAKLLDARAARVAAARAKRLAARAKKSTPSAPVE